MDVSKFTKSEGEYLSADDLVGGGILVVVYGVSEIQGKRPVLITVQNGVKPFNPCKNMVRLLEKAWSSESKEWIGRTISLYRDETAEFKNEAVGGVRINGLSDVSGNFSVTFTETRRKKKTYNIKKIDRLVLGNQQQTKPAPAAEFMPESVFAEKMPAVEQAIASGKITHEAAIARLEKSGLLTEEQKKTVMSCAGPTPEPAPEAAPEAAPDSDIFG